MQLTLLEEQAQFDQLKKDDIIIVKWNRRAREYKRGNEIDTYHMVEIKNNEVILRVKDNVYFSVDAYLDGESTAAEAYALQS